VGRLSGRYRMLALVGLGIVVLAISSLALGHVVVDRCGGWSGCDANGLPLGIVTVRDLETHKEATLYYPGATLIGHAATAEHDPFVGSRGLAATSSIVATRDQAGSVYAWYDDWLLARGWRHGDVLRSTAELSVRSWNRGSREFFDVAILYPARMQSIFGNQIPSDRTLIQTRYGITPAGEALPSPLST